MRVHLDWDEAEASAIIAQHAGEDGPCLVILRALQEAFGHVPAATIPMIAQALNLSRAEVHGIVSFYHDFRREKPGRHMLRLCRAEACQSVGAEALAAHCQRRLGIPWHGTTADGAVTLEPVFCLGLCASGPSAMLDGEPIGRLDDARLDAVLEALG